MMELYEVMTRIPVGPSEIKSFMMMQERKLKVMRMKRGLLPVMCETKEGNEEEGYPHPPHLPPPPSCQPLPASSPRVFPLRFCVWTSSMNEERRREGGNGGEEEPGERIIPDEYIPSGEMIVHSIRNWSLVACKIGSITCNTVLVAENCDFFQWSR